MVCGRLNLYQLNYKLQTHHCKYDEYATGNEWDNDLRNKDIEISFAVCKFTDTK